MPKITIDIDDAVVDRFADAVALANARRALADGGLIPKDDAPGSAPPDPWAGDTGSSGGRADDASTAATAPSGAGSAPDVPPDTGTVVVNAKNGPQQWTLGAANAPTCNCGRPAAYVQGATNGRPWKRWACAYGAGSEWRNKCDFSQWA